MQRYIFPFSKLPASRCKFRANIITILLGAAILFGIQGCDRERYRNVEGMVWNTTYHITFKGDKALGDSILEVLSDVGKSLNVFDKNSLTSKVNNRKETEVDKAFSDVYEISVKVNRASGGMFDPTLSPLITAWGFGPGHTISSDSLSTDSILAYVGIGKTTLSGKILSKEDIRTEFNFSAVAKGYGCDMVAEMFRRNGVSDYLIEIGGEIAVGGESPRGGKWNISIDSPVESATEVIHDSYIVISVTDAGIATSGNYRNYLRQGDKSFGHTISPVTGRPVTTDVISATVVAPTCAEADAAATACMAAGKTVGAKMLEALGYDGLLILSDSTAWMTEGFKQLAI